MDWNAYFKTLIAPFRGYFSLKWLLITAFFIAICIRSVYLSFDLDGWRRASMSIIPKGNIILAEAITGTPFIPVIDWGYLDPEPNFQNPVSSCCRKERSVQNLNLPPKKWCIPVPQLSASSKRKRQEAYVKRFHTVAQAEMKQFGIPASVTLAQGLLESDAGE